MTISTIRSGKGDCIRIRFVSDRVYNIIIDTGPTATVGEYRKLVNGIISSGEIINLLFITHYDDDHIGGALKVNDIPYKNVYFNAYDGSLDNNNLSALQNQRLFHLLPDAIVHTSVMAGDVITIGGASIIIHAPSISSLQNAMERMKKDDMLLSTVSDWSFTLDELMERPYPVSDTSISNRASIVFTMECENRKVLFCGDAWASTIPGGTYDLVKLPHHGSIRNITDDLLDSWDCHNFLICADGTSHPNKQTIAKLLKRYKQITIFSNYAWWMNGFFKVEDMKYIQEGRISFKEGVIQYGET